MDGVLAGLENLPAIAALRESSLAYPLVNAAHIVGIALLFGAIVPLDLRLMGWRRNAVALDTLASTVLPIAIAGFLVAALAGFFLFATDARAYAGSWLFRAKLLTIAMALLNAFWLRRIDWHGPSASDRALAAAGAISLLAWLATILLGRLLGYF